MEHLIDGHGQAWLAAAQVLALVFWKPLAALGQMLLGVESRRQSRIERLEDLIDDLRRALDKGRIRENAIAAIAELLVFAIDHLEQPSAAVLSLKRRALEVLRVARAHLESLEESER